MRIVNTRHHILRDCKTHYTDAGTRDWTDDMKRDYVAFCSLLWHPGEQRLFCGVTAMDSNVLAKFNPATGRFEPLDYRPIAESFEVKVHRSLELGADGTVYGATSCLYGLDQRRLAPGGALFRIPPGGTPQKLAVPLPHDYIQTITLDDQRGLIYGLTYPVFNFFVYHLATGEVENHGFMGSITHISAIDDDGGFWSTWDNVHHYLFRYDPATRDITYFRHGLPNAKAEANMMYPGAGPVDCMINGGDGFLYIGTTGGQLCRLNPKTAEVTYLGKPAATTRLPGLVLWHDSLLLGAAGDNEGGCIFSYDRETGAFRLLGPVHDAQSNRTLFRVHDLRLADKTHAFVAETDVPDRSGYLWECELEI
ncbi:MAG: hypothetical protein K9N49_01195 [Candidatus Marinimicrobia bacterium]|nr:hypothetical protein [Candidatus Neomarinimicrobiota bacterium]